VIFPLHDVASLEKLLDQPSLIIENLSDMTVRDLSFACRLHDLSILPGILAMQVYSIHE
jgi:hypothetical protein